MINWDLQFPKRNQPARKMTMTQVMNVGASAPAEAYNTSVQFSEERIYENS